LQTTVTHRQLGFGRKPNSDCRTMESFPDSLESPEGFMPNGDDGTRATVAFENDCQSRPHVILMCKELTKARLGLRRHHQPSYWDLPVGDQADLFYRQLGKARELGALRVEVHLGKWVSKHTSHIHAHVVLPVARYFHMRAVERGQLTWTDSDIMKRARYVEQKRRELNGFIEKDRPGVASASRSGTPQRRPHNADLAAFKGVLEGVIIDAESGTSAIDLNFRRPPSEMSTDELAGVMAGVQAFCRGLSIDGAHLLYPAPAAGEAGRGGVPNMDVARLVVPPDQFVLCLPRERRPSWVQEWQTGNPLDRAYKEDLSLLSRGEAAEAEL
jgi:hypothetical protein